MLNGITPEEVMRQWAALTPLPQVAPRLSGRAVLLVSAGQDDFFPPEHLRLLAEAQPEIEWKTVEGADHTFTLHRRALAALVIDWLQRTVGG
jgi:pimeloyl-ACP methyl ester carboxylesterase